MSEPRWLKAVASRVRLTALAGTDDAAPALVVARYLWDVTNTDRPSDRVTRTGDLSPTDADFAWFSAARDGFGRHDLEPPGFFVVTRYGWFNLANDDVVRWRRVRPHRSRAASGS